MAPLRLSSATNRRSVRRACAGLVVLGLALALGGCASWTSWIPWRGKKKTSSAPPPPATYVAPAHQSLGRVVSHDAKAGVALVELSPFAAPPSNWAGRALIARDAATLAPTARLVASTHRSGTIVGAYVVEGTPEPDNEVVLPPAP